MHQYMDMQYRILTAANTASPLPDKNDKTEDFTHTKQNLSIEKEIQEALDKEEFLVLYQPIIRFKE